MMRCYFPEKMRHSILVLIIAFLLISFPCTPVSSQNEPLQNVTPEIKSVTTIPSIPVINDDINVTVVISKSGGVMIDNLTLVYSIDDNQTSVKMQHQTSTKYEYIIPSQAKATLIDIVVVLYFENTILDTYEISISVVNHPSDRALVMVPENRSIGLTRGNYSLQSMQREVVVNTSVSKPVEFTFRGIPRDKSEKPGGLTFLSDIFEIEVNQTHNLVNTILSIKYNQSLLESFGSILDQIRLISRPNSTSDWAIANDTLIQNDGYITTPIVHFSQWAVATADAKVQIIPESVVFNADVNKELSITFTIRNTGNINAENLSLQIYGPSRLLILPDNAISSVDILSPLESVNSSWIVYPELIAEYNIILQVVDQDGFVTSQVIKINTLPYPSDPPTDVQSSTSLSPFQLIVIYIMATFIIIVRFRKYIR